MAVEDKRSIGTFDNLTLERQGCVFIITMRMGAENRLNIKFCQEMIQAFNTVRETLGTNFNGAVITRGQDAKFFCTGLDLEETRRVPHANADGFYPCHELETGLHLNAPVDRGMYFPGVGILPWLKLQPRVARKVLLEGHRFTGVEALEDGLVDAIAEPEKMLGVALELANKWVPKAKAGVYALLRSELSGEMDRAVQQISYVRSRSTFLPGKAKI